MLEMILTPGNNAILMVYQINACYDTYACDGIPPYQLGLRFVKSTPINDSLKEAV